MNARLPAAFSMLVTWVSCVTSCAQAIEPTLDVTQSSSTLIVHPANGTSTSGSSMQLTVKRRYPEGDVQDVTSAVAYTIEKGIGTVSATGLVTAGSDIDPIIIRVSDRSSDATALTSVQVVAAQIVAIDLTPSPVVVLAPAASRLFTASARYNSGDVLDVSMTVSWSSTDETVAIAGNEAGDRGLVQAVAAGETTILATDNATQVQGRATVIVAAPSVALVSIAVTPNPASVSVGGTAQLRADGFYSDGTTKELTPNVTWSSSRPDIATVSPQGLLAGVTLGDATVTATSPDNAQKNQGVAGSAAVKVVP